MNENAGSPFKWILLLGGGGCLLGLLVCGGCFGAVFFGVFGAIKGSEPYTRSLNAVQGSPELQAAIGTPIEPGMMVSGNISVSGDSGEADLSYSVSGPKGSANVNVVGTKTAGVWDYSVMKATLADGTMIDFLGEEVAPEDPVP